MKIVSIRPLLKKLALSKPYTIAGYTFTDAENVFLEIELENGMVGLGAASPAEEVVGETGSQTFTQLQAEFFQAWMGKDIRHFRTLIADTCQAFPALPGTQAVVDIALHDAFCQYLGIPIVALYGQKIHQLPTSVTIGIMSVDETLREAEAYKALGFRVLKVKTGENVEEDCERVLKLHERFGITFTIRVDANQGYGFEELTKFIRTTQHVGIEVIEQPLVVGEESTLLSLDSGVRERLVADESLKDARKALQLTHSPQPFGVFNIKLMKCGGILNAFDIATIAKQADIGLFWGCNDESRVSIAAALHAAFACPNTRYLDLDGSFDLAEDLVTGGFVLEEGYLRLTDKPGLGVERIVK